MDLTHLTLAQIVIVLFALTALDFISGIFGAITSHTFTLDAVALFVESHILGRVVPLSFAAAVGIGVSAFGLPPNPAIFAIFLTGGAAYLAETVASIATNLGAGAAVVPSSQASNPNPTDPVPHG